MDRHRYNSPRNKAHTTDIVTQNVRYLTLPFGVLVDQMKAIQTQHFCTFTQHLKAYARMVPYIRYRTLPSTYASSTRSRIILVLNLYYIRNFKRCGQAGNWFEFERSGFKLIGRLTWLRLCDFPQSLQSSTSNINSNYATSANFHILSNLLFSNNPIIQCSVIWSTESIIVKQNTGIFNDVK